MKNFRISKEISSLKPSISKWHLTALLSIFLPNNGMYASSDDKEESSESNESLYYKMDTHGNRIDDGDGERISESNESLSNQTDTHGNRIGDGDGERISESNESLSNQTDTGGTNDEDIEELRERIKQINFELIKTGKIQKGSRKNSPLHTLNKALKRIKITIPRNDEIQSFIKPYKKKKITVYKLLKKLLYKDSKSNNTSLNSSENIVEEVALLKTPLEECPALLLDLLNEAIEGYCKDEIKDIEDKKISSILKEVLGEYYNYIYLREVYRLKYPKGHHRTNGINLLYAMKSCDKEAYFDALELHKEMYNDSSSSSEDDTNTVVLCNPLLEELDLEESDLKLSLDIPTNNDSSVPVPLYIIFTSSAAGLGYWLHKKRKKSTKKKQIEGDTTYIEDEDGDEGDTQQIDTTEIGEGDV